MEEVNVLNSVKNAMKQAMDKTKETINFATSVINNLADPQDHDSGSHEHHDSIIINDEDTNSEQEQEVGVSLIHSIGRTSILDNKEFRKAFAMGRQVQFAYQYHVIANLVVAVGVLMFIKYKWFTEPVVAIQQKPVSTVLLKYLKHAIILNVTSLLAIVVSAIWSIL